MAIFKGLLLGATSTLVMAGALNNWGSAVAIAAQFSFTPIAVSGGQFAAFKVTETTPPFFPTTTLGLSLNNQGNVAFFGTLGTGDAGVFLGNGQTVTTVALSQDVANQFNSFAPEGEFLLGTPPTPAIIQASYRLETLDLNNSNEVVYGASRSSVGFRAGDSSPTVFGASSGVFGAENMILSRSFLGSPLSLVSSQITDLEINDHGTVAGSLLQSGRPLRGSRGSIFRMVDQGDLEKISPGSAFSARATLNGKDEVFYSAEVPAPSSFSVWRPDGSLARVVEDSFGFSPPVFDANDRGDLLISGTVLDPLTFSQRQTGLYFQPRNGELELLLAGSVGAIALNNSGGFVFERSGALFNGLNLAEDKVIGVGDRLLNSTITQLSLVVGKSLNDQGSVAFWASLEDGRTAIVRADRISDPVSTPEPGLGAGGWGLGVGVMLGLAAWHRPSKPMAI